MKTSEKKSALKKAEDYFYKAVNETEYKKKIEFFIEAIRLNPKYGEAQNKLGDIYFVTGDFKKAIECYQMAINSGDTKSSYVQDLEKARKALAKQKEKENIEENAESLKKAKDFYSAALDEADFNKKIALYTKAIELDRTNARVYNNRGDTYFAMSQFEKAVQDYQKAFDLAKTQGNTDYFYEQDLKNAKEALEEERKYQNLEKRQNTILSPEEIEKINSARIKAEQEAEKLSQQAKAAQKQADESETARQGLERELGTIKSQSSHDARQRKLAEEKAKIEEQKRLQAEAEATRVAQEAWDAKENARLAEENRKRMEQMFNELKESSNTLSEWERSLIAQSVITQIMLLKPKTQSDEERMNMVENLILEQLQDHNGVLLKSYKEEDVLVIRNSVLAKIDAVHTGEQVPNIVKPEVRRDILKKIAKEINNKLKNNGYAESSAEDLEKDIMQMIVKEFDSENIIFGPDLLAKFLIQAILECARTPVTTYGPTQVSKEVLNLYENAININIDGNLSDLDDDVRELVRNTRGIVNINIKNITNKSVLGSLMSAKVHLLSGNKLNIASENKVVLGSISDNEIENLSLFNNFISLDVWESFSKWAKKKLGIEENETVNDGCETKKVDSLPNEKGGEVEQLPKPSDEKPEPANHPEIEYNTEPKVKIAKKEYTIETKKDNPNKQMQNIFIEYVSSLEEFRNISESKIKKASQFFATTMEIKWRSKLLQLYGNAKNFRKVQNGVIVDEDDILELANRVVWFGLSRKSVMQKSLDMLR